MVRTCFLCDQKASPTNNISLHSFPKKPNLRSKWLKACGLNSRDDVRGIFICCDHFVEEDVCKGNTPGRVNLKCTAVPRLFLKNPLVIGESNDKTFYINEEVVDESPTFLTTDNVTVILHDEMSCDDNIEENLEQYEKLSNDETEMQVFTNEDEKIVLNKNINSNQVKKRRFFEPRYISELTISDFEYPDIAGRTIRLIKESDESKSKKIRCLQRQVRQLQKKIDFLEQKVDHLKKYPATNFDREFLDVTDDRSNDNKTV